MSDPDQVIPFDRLPRDFARRLERPAEPAPARPAATVVILREASVGMEVLLLKRARSAGFVPGAYVFPGGRVDTEDGEARLLSRLIDRSEDAWGERLGAGGIAGAAYLAAALRETFEETGLLVARKPEGGFAPSGAEDEEVDGLRTRLLRGEVDFAGVLEALDLLLDDAQAEYIAHWVTPEAEPRRYDTRFFAVRVPRDVPIAPWEEEVVDHVWISPASALERCEAGELPMVFPTIRTLEDLTAFSHPDQVLEHFRGLDIPRILPRLVRTPTGVGIEVPDGP